MPGEALRLYRRPLLELLSEAHLVHRQHHDLAYLQKCALLSIKTGGCPEDCGYCAQSAHHAAGVERQPLLTVDDVITAATNAKQAGAHRFCMGAAWRTPPGGSAFEQVLAMIREVKALDLEACATLGTLSLAQARGLKEAGLNAYNHNLDTSSAYFPQVGETRRYADRLTTLRTAREAGLTLCCGGIFGMGEREEDRCALLDELAAFDPHPESVPLNLLVPISGTPLADSAPVPALEFIRLVAVARILLPNSRIRLAAGRKTLSGEAQALAFLAGANSIFIGNKLLTTPNTEPSVDDALLGDLYGEHAKRSEFPVLLENAR